MADDKSYTIDFFYGWNFSFFKVFFIIETMSGFVQQQKKNMENFNQLHVCQVNLVHLTSSLGLNEKTF